MRACRAIPCYATLYAMPMPYFNLSAHAMPCYALRRCHALPCPCPTLSYPEPDLASTLNPNHVLPCRTLRECPREPIYAGPLKCWIRTRAAVLFDMILKLLIYPSQTSRTWNLLDLSRATELNLHFYESQVSLCSCSSWASSSTTMRSHLRQTHLHWCVHAHIVALWCMCLT